MNTSNLPKSPNNSSPSLECKSEQAVDVKSMGSKRSSPPRSQAKKHFDSEFIYYSGNDPAAALEATSRKTPSQRKPKRESRKGTKNSSTSPSSSSTGHHSALQASRKKPESSSKTNNGRWTGAEHFRFLEALKTYGKEWQKVQSHVDSRTSTQARSHAQKFFLKLEKANLTLEEFLRDLDLEKVRKSLMNMNSTNYDEEDAVKAVAKKKLAGASPLAVSVMNVALPNKKAEATSPKASKKR